VFAGATGKPLWADNLAKRALKPLAVNLAMPWLSSHVFRHTCATLTKSLGMLDVDRRVLMGHADGNMTDRYTHEDFERMRRAVELVATEITKAPKTDDPDATADVAPRSNVIEIRRVG
jgi:integrase